MTYEDEVRQAITDSGLTRYAIAKQTGVNEAALSRFMAGQIGMTLATLEKLRPIIRVSIKPAKRRRKDS